MYPRPSSRSHGSEMTTQLATPLRESLENAVSRLMSVRVDGARARVTVPVSYPSGAGCAVEITLDGGRCFVSDLGLGRTEAEMMGAEEFYDPIARVVSKRFGVGYDGLSVFAIWSSLENVESAIMGVANASAQSAGAAVLRAAEEKDRQRNTELFDRVVTIFGQKKVTRTAELSGKEATWEAHNVVLLSSGRRAVFEYVSGHQNSVSSKYMMFSDLIKVEGAFSLTSVVPSLDRLGKKGAMLADVSHVIELSAARDKFVRVAEAA